MWCVVWCDGVWCGNLSRNCGRSVIGSPDFIPNIIYDTEEKKRCLYKFSSYERIININIKILLEHYLL